MLDAEVPSTSTLQTDLLSESDLTDAFTQEGAADTLRGLAYGTGSRHPVLRLRHDAGRSV